MQSTEQFNNNVIMKREEKEGIYRMRKRKWAAGMLLSLAIAVTSLTGCQKPALPGTESTEKSGSAESSKNNANTDNQKTDTVEGSKNNTDQNGFEGVKVTVFTDEIITNDETFMEYFNQNSGGIELEIVSGDMTKLMSMVATGNAPDVWYTRACYDLNTYASRGLLEPLDSYIEKSEVFHADTFTNVVNATRFNGVSVGTGSIYSIIKDFSVDDMIWINKKIFEECGIEIPDPTKTYSYDQIREWAEKTVKYDENGDQIRWGISACETLYQKISAHLASMGKSLFSEDNRSAQLDDPDVRNVLEYWVDMIKSGKSCYLEHSGDASYALFEQDKLAMMQLGYWYNGLLVNNGNFKDRLDNYLLIQSPSQNEGSPAGVCEAGVGYAIYSGSKNKDAAFRFLELFLGGDWAKKRVESGWGNPELGELVEYMPQDTEFRKMAFDSNKIALENMSIMSINPYILGSAVDNVFNTYLMEVMYDNMTMDDAIESISNDLNTLIREGLQIAGVE